MFTRSAGKPLVSPYSDPERLLRRQGIESVLYSDSDKDSSEEEEKIVLEHMAEGGEQPPPNPFDVPMINRARAVPNTRGSAIRTPTLGDDFSVKGHHLKMIQDDQFDGGRKSDPHRHIENFMELCKMFKYGRGMEEGVMLSLFPSSLTGEARVWMNELEPDTIQTWGQLREAFVTRFFPPALGRKLLNQIRGFQQWDEETITDAWIRLKDLMRNCHGHNLDREQMVDIFYNGLDHHSQHDLDLAGGGSFLYKSTNEAYKMMEDQVLASIARNRVNKDKRTRSMVASVEGSSGDSSTIVKEIKAMSDKMDKRMGRLEKDVHMVKNGCEVCGGPHYSDECNQQQPEDVKFAQNDYNNRGNYQNRGGNYGYGEQRNRWQRNNSPSYQRPRYEENKPKEEEDQSLKDMMKSFIHTQINKNEGMTNQMKVMNEHLEQGQRNHQAAMQDLERRFDRMSERVASKPTTHCSQPNQGQSSNNNQQNAKPQSSQPNQGPKYQPPSARNEQLNMVHVEAKEVLEAEETVMEKEPEWEAVEIVNNVKEALISPLIVERNLDRELDELEKLIFEEEVHTMEPGEENRISSEMGDERGGQYKELGELDFLLEIPGIEADQQQETTRNEEGTMESELAEDVTLPTKCVDKGAISIPIQFNNLPVLALVDSGASANFMPISLYHQLNLPEMKERNVRVKLASQDYTYPLGIVEDVAIEVENFKYLTDFIILNTPEDSSFPIIVGRPFLRTARANLDFDRDQITLFSGKKSICLPRADNELKESCNTDNFCEKNLLNQEVQVNVATVSPMDLIKRVTGESREEEGRLVHPIPKKLEDTGSLSVPLNFNGVTINGLADSGAGANIMPLSIYLKLKLPRFESCNLRINLAHVARTQPIGKVKDVLVKVENFTYLVDFIILNMGEDSDYPIILGRPFLRTAGANLDFQEEVIRIKSGNRTLVFGWIDTNMQVSGNERESSSLK